jgi:hypothetical protein
MMTAAAWSLNLRFKIISSSSVLLVDLPSLYRINLLVEDLSRFGIGFILRLKFCFELPNKLIADLGLGLPDD